MAQTYFGSTLRSGSGTLTDSTDGGFVVLTQTATVTTNADGSASSVTGSPSCWLTDHRPHRRHDGDPSGWWRYRYNLPSDDWHRRPPVLSTCRQRTPSPVAVLRCPSRPLSAPPWLTLATTLRWL